MASGRTARAIGRPANITTRPSRALQQGHLPEAVRLHGAGGRRFAAGRRLPDAARRRLSAQRPLRFGPRHLCRGGSARSLERARRAQRRPDPYRAGPPGRGRRHSRQYRRPCAGRRCRPRLRAGRPRGAGGRSARSRRPARRWRRRAPGRIWRWLMPLPATGTVPARSRRRTFRRPKSTRAWRNGRRWRAPAPARPRSRPCSASRRARMPAGRSRSRSARPSPSSPAPTASRSPRRPRRRAAQFAPAAGADAGRGVQLAANEARPDEAPAFWAPPESLSGRSSCRGARGGCAGARAARDPAAAACRAGALRGACRAARRRCRSGRRRGHAGPGLRAGRGRVAAPDRRPAADPGRSRDPARVAPRRLHPRRRRCGAAALRLPGRRSGSRRQCPRRRPARRVQQRSQCRARLAAGLGPLRPRRPPAADHDLLLMAAARFTASPSRASPSRADAQRLCSQIRSHGGLCFVRANAGDASIRWAARYASPRQRNV